MSKVGRTSCRWKDTIKVHIKDSVGRVWTGLSWLKIDVAVCSERGSEPSGSIKWEKVFFD